jgi:tetratricopeptide (TPR) repeat protein
MQQRRLAAIMFTDIVGYTSMMGKDEKKAFETLRKNRRIQWRLIKKYRGRWLKEMGDGILASFSSNIDAVMCAVSIQKAAEEVNIPLRVGIHQGDVIFENKDVLGDGVNIASRIQGVADTNGIVISETVYNDIKNKEGIDIEFLGKKTLKGVESSIGAYKVNCKDNSFLEYTIDTGELVRPLGFGRTPIIVGILIIALLAFALYYFLPKIINPQSELGNSVLVLPFDNYTGSDTLEYFVAGMHSSLIGDIGKISALRVISKTKAYAYKDVEKSIQEIASEFQVKLVSAYPAEQTLWVQDFYVERSQILNLYNRVTKEISNEINVILTPEEDKMLAESRTVNTEVYDLYMRSQVYWEQLSKDALNRAREYLTLAIEKDPDWAPLYAGLAKVWSGLAQMGHVSPEIAMPNIYDNLNKALELDPDYAGSHFTNGVIGVWVEWNWEKGEKEFLTALELNPNDVLSRIYYAHLLMNLGRLDEALLQGQLAIDLDPLNPLIQTLFAAVLMDTGNYQSAMMYCEKALLADPSSPLTAWIVWQSAYLNGDYERAFETGLKIFPMEVEAKIAIKETFEEKGFFETYEEMCNTLEENAQEDYILPYLMAITYYMLNNGEKVLDWLEKGYEIHDQNMPYMYADFADFEPIKDDPRFIELLKKMNLPYP